MAMVEKVPVKSNCLPHLTQTHVNLAFQNHIVHHAASLRWWIAFARQHNEIFPQYHENETKLISENHFNELASSRSFLWKIALVLDLETDDNFRAQALAYSKLITAEEEKKLRAIFNNTTLKLEGVPRRLVLAKALVETALVTEKKLLRSVRARLSEASSKTDAITEEVYQDWIRPLVLRADKKITELNKIKGKKMVKS